MSDFSLGIYNVFFDLSDLRFRVLDKFLPLNYKITAQRIC